MVLQSTQNSEEVFSTETYSVLHQLTNASPGSGRMLGPIPYYKVLNILSKNCKASAYRRKELGWFHTHSHSIHQTITFSMQTDENCKLLLLSVLVKWKSDSMHFSLSCHAGTANNTQCSINTSHQPLIGETETVCQTVDTDMSDNPRLLCIICGIS
jgi:hypothetical protein